MQPHIVPLSIPFHGNIPLRGNSVDILFISSETFGIFYLNLENVNRNRNVSIEIA